MFGTANQYNTNRARKKAMFELKHSQNIIHTLRDRESGFTGRNHNVHFSALPMFSYEKRFYSSIMPTLTVHNVQAPCLFMRKFTPNGQMLLSICSAQRSLVVWSFKGAGSAAHILKDETRECIASRDIDNNSKRIRSELFKCLFKKKFIVRLAINSFSRYNVHREFSIFFDNGRYVMLAGSLISETNIEVDFYWNYPDLYDNLDLYSYVFFLIDLRTGAITDIRTFAIDHIILAHNNGVAVYGQTIAIFSRFRQYVALFEVSEGILYEIEGKGAFPTLFENVSDNFTIDSSIPLSQIKQRVLSYMFRDIMKETYEPQRKHRLKKFYQKYPTYEHMLMEKIQLIDENHLLIRFEEKPINSRDTDSLYANEFKLYAFYSLPLDKILHICERHSTNLLFMLRDYCDQFRNTRSLLTGLIPSSPCNDESFRTSFNYAIRTFAGGPREAASRFNQTIPISTQSYATTPYLCYSMFSYDDRLISALERPKLSTSVPIRFCNRDTHQVKFRLQLEQRTNSSTRELVAFIFHPIEPFFISIQKLNNGYFLNFHIYNRNTIVSQ